MTNEQIISLVKQYFTEEWCEEDGHGWTEFAGKPDAFLKFARAIRQDVPPVEPSLTVPIAPSGVL